MFPAVSDRRLYVIFCLGWFLALAYRDAILDHSFSGSGWLAFSALWLAIAIVTGLLVSFAVSRAGESSGRDPNSAWVLPMTLAVAAGVCFATGNAGLGVVLGGTAIVLRWNSHRRSVSD
jgi:hypothetical protein